MAEVLESLKEEGATWEYLELRNDPHDYYVFASGRGSGLGLSFPDFRIKFPGAGWGFNSVVVENKAFSGFPTSSQEAIFRLLALYYQRILTASVDPRVEPMLFSDGHHSNAGRLGIDGLIEDSNSLVEELEWRLDPETSNPIALELFKEELDRIGRDKRAEWLAMTPIDRAFVAEKILHSVRIEAERLFAPERIENEAMRVAVAEKIAADLEVTESEEIRREAILITREIQIKRDRDERLKAAENGKGASGGARSVGGERRIDPVRDDGDDNRLVRGSAPVVSEDLKPESQSQGGEILGVTTPELIPAFGALQERFRAGIKPVRLRPPRSPSRRCARCLTAVSCRGTGRRFTRLISGKVVIGS